MEFFLKYINEFWKLTVEMAPWLLLGLLVAGLLKSYFPTKKINKYLGKNNLASILKAAFLGVPMPLCSCAVLPTGISLYKKGASAGATSAFLISTPQTGIDSILATQALMGLPLAIMRPFIAFITGIFGGILMNIFNVKNSNKGAEKEIKTTGKCCSSCESDHSKENKLKTALHFAFVEMIKDMGKWLIIGLALGSFISVLMPDTLLEQYIGSGFIEMFVIIIVSIPLYICATASIPIASSLILKGLSPGAAIVFLMAGPATNIATLTVIKKTIGTKFMWLYLFSILLGALFFGFLINSIFTKDFFIQYISTTIMHHHYTNIIYTVASIVLLSLIFYALFLDRFFNKKIIIAPTTKTIKVEGITCNHCKNDLEEKISSIKGVTKALVHLQNQEVHVEGNFDVQNIKTTNYLFGIQNNRIMNLKKIVNDPQATFIDVRKAKELEEDGKIEKAIHIPLDDIPYQIEEIEQMPKPIVIFCRAGHRAEKAIEVLEQNGVDELYNGGGLTDMQALLE